MATRTISTTIKLDGEKEFRSAMSEINSSLKVSKSEMALLESEFRDQANSVEYLRKKDALLTAEKEQQSEKVRALQQALADATEKYGEGSKQADSYRIQLNNAQTALNGLNDKLTSNARYLEEAEKSSDGTASSIDEYGKEVKDAEEKTSTFGEVLKANLASDAIKSGITGLKDSIKAVGTAVKDAVSGFADMVSETASTGDEIDKQSQKIQVSAEEYQKLSFAAERCGTSISAMETANKTLQKSDFSGNMYDAILAVSELTDADERAAKATELFGSKAGQELLPLLNSGSEGIQALFDEVEGLGGVMSNDAVAASATYEDSLTNLTTAFDGMKNNLVSEFLPSVTGVMDGLTMIISGDVDGGVEAVKQGIEDFATQAEELGPIAMDMINLLIDTIIELLPDILDAAGDIVISLCDGILTAIPDLIPVAVEVIDKLVNYFINNLPMIINMAIDIIITLAEGLVSAIPQLVSYLPQIISAVIGGLGKMIEEVPQIGKDLIEGLWNGIKDMATWVKEKIQGFGSDILDSLKGFFGIHSPSTVMRDEVGKNLALGVVEGFNDSIESSSSSMASAVSRAINAADLRLMSRMMVGLEQADLSYDLDGDGLITAADTRLASRSLSGGGQTVSITVNAAQGQNEKQIAQYVMDEIQRNINRKGAAFA